jgi:hypothetical protein
VATGTADELIGATRASTRVRFRLPEGIELPGRFAARQVGPALEIEADEPTRALHGLTEWALSADTHLLDLEVMRRSLEDVYLQLTAEASTDGDGEPT